MIPELIKNNCELRLFDPEGMHEAKRIFKNIQKIFVGVKILMMPVME